MKKEILNPDTLTVKLKERLQELQNVLNIKLKSQRNQPEGHLRIDYSNNGHKIQYFHRTNPKDFKGIYIKKSNISLARKLAQKDYDLKIIKEVRRQIKALEEYISSSENKITKLYSSLSISRQELVEPVTLTDKQFIEQWQDISWQGRSFEEKSDLITDRLEMVRSKSELIIANTLNRKGIPYRYEYPLQLRQGKIFHPDFLCLNVRTRKEIYWEHFGMLDIPEYAENAVHKLKLFNENDILLGKNLIITTESRLTPISSSQIEKVIKEYLS